VAGTIDEFIDIKAGTTITIEQWPGQAPAVLDGSAPFSEVIIARGNLTLDGITVTNGSRSGILAESDTVTINDSTITGNTGNEGGGISVDGASVTITDSTITNNSAGFAGGGIANVNSSTLTITDSTISGNTATGTGASGAGIYGFNNSTTTIGASIVAGNTTNGALNNCSGITPTSVGYNLTDDSGAACGFTKATDKVNTSPDLGVLAANGGSTETLLPGPTSPAVGVIPKPTTLNGVLVCGRGAFDQRGVTRPSPGPNPMCTIGAVEVQGPVPQNDNSHANNNVQ
jgi:hypothetical protein